MLTVHTIKTSPPNQGVAGDSKSEKQSRKCSALVYHSHIFTDNLTWTLTMGFTPDHGTPSHIPMAPIVFVCLQQIGDLLITVDGSKLCIGNPNEQYSR